MLRRHTCSPLAGPRLSIAVVGLALCAKKKPPIARPTPPPPGSTRRHAAASTARAGGRAAAGERAARAAIGREHGSRHASLDEINKQSPLQPVFFEFDSAEMSADGQAALTKNAEILKTNATWVISIEGHCDERGTAEYNLALGERRALAARTYLVSLGIAAGSAAHGELRQGVPVRPGPQRDVVVEEPPRALRRDREVGDRLRRRICTTDEDACHARRPTLLCCALRLRGRRRLPPAPCSARVAARRRQPRAPADDGRHPHAAGAEPAAAGDARHAAGRAQGGRPRGSISRPRARASRWPTRSC